MSVTENVKTVRAKIDEAAAAAGRDPGEILLVAATKMNDTPRVREAIEAGVDICGENRVQEMLQKHAEGAYEGCPLHFIGHLQTNKVRQVVGLAALIHSVDSTGLLAAIDKAAASKGIVQDVLIEINIAGEESKSGISPQELPAVLEAASGLSSVRIRGLMAIPPICEKPEDNIPYFCTMNQLFVDNSKKKYNNVHMDFLSMGMSGDYCAAISCGANLVRVGTAIFGRRIYPPKVCVI